MFSDLIYLWDNTETQVTSNHKNVAATQVLGHYTDKTKVQSLTTANILPTKMYPFTAWVLKPEDTMPIDKELLRKFLPLFQFSILAISWT